MAGDQIFTCRVFVGDERKQEDTLAYLKTFSIRLAFSDTGEVVKLSSLLQQQNNRGHKNSSKNSKQTYFRLFMAVRVTCVCSKSSTTDGFTRTGNSAEVRCEVVSPTDKLVFAWYNSTQIFPGIQSTSVR